MRYLRDVSTLELLEERCSGCGMCIEVCPHSVFEMNGRKACVGDRDACMECGACARNCPELAIRVQAGVGCAQAVINNALGRKGSCCNLDDYQSGEGGCGCPEPERDPACDKPERTGCC